MAQFQRFSSAFGGEADEKVAAGAREEDPDSSPGSICALIDNRQREVGLCVFEPSTLRLFLAQYIEAGTSATPITAMLLAAYNVEEAVVLGPLASGKGRGSEVLGQHVTPLMRQAAAHLPQQTFHLPRSAFDDSKGQASLSTYGTTDSWTKVQRAVSASGSSGLYLAFGAANALIQHLMADEQNVVMSKTLEVELVGTSAHMRLSASSVECLEILPRGTPAVLVPQQRSVPPTSAGPTVKAPRHKPHLAHRSLLDCMNHTHTSVGARLLRASLMQPLTDTLTLSMRYDAVEELLESHELQLDVSKVLKLLPKALDKVCSSLAVRPASGKPGSTAAADPSRRISTSINSVLLLRSTLLLLPSLADCLQPCTCDLLRAVASTCTQDVYSDMLSEIDKVMDPDCTTSTSAFINRIQQCFAVKEGTDPLLDVARTAFCRVTEQVHELAEQYQQTLTYHTQIAHNNKQQPSLFLKVSYNDRSGFYLSVTPTGKKASNRLQDITLPRVFLPLDKRSRSSLLVTTHELNALNVRLRDNAHDCLVLTAQIMDGLVQHLVSNLGLLLKLVDNLALLDLMCSMSLLAAAAPGQYCRPHLKDRGHVLAISQGRHPLLEHTPGCTVQPNDTHIDGDTVCMHLITGPNMAGKTTYLKQVGLLVVMAQAGSLVPAAFMQLRPFTQLFTRMGHGDNIETNSSSFMVEMQEVAHILDHADSHSLVLIDELGRATSTADGVALAWSVSEALLSARSACLFATHLVQLSQLVDTYPQAKLWTLQVNVAGSQLEYSRCMQPAHTFSNWSYGLALATSLGFPPHLIEAAKRVADKQMEQAQQQVQQAQGNHATQGLSKVFAFASKLLALANQAADTLMEVAGEQGEGGNELVDTLDVCLPAIAPGAAPTIIRVPADKARAQAGLLAKLGPDAEAVVAAGVGQVEVMPADQ